MKQTKKNKIITNEIKDNIIFKIDEAIATSKKFASKKFDETLDVIVVLGIDAKKSDQQIRGIMSLPKMPSKKIKIGNREIIFKRTVPRNMATAETITGLIIQAFKYIGKENIDKKHIAIIKSRLNDNDLIELKRNAYLAPAWIARLINIKIIEK